MRLNGVPHIGQQYGLLTERDLETLLSICRVIEARMAVPDLHTQQHVALVREMVAQFRAEDGRGVHLEKASLILLAAMAKAGHHLAQLHDPQTNTSELQVDDTELLVKR